MTVLSIAGVSLAYGGHDVLTNVSARLDSGDRAGLVGPNGAGKTTLLRVIAGEERPNDGAVALAGGRRLGYVPQIPHVDPSRTVREEVLSGIAHLAELETGIERAAHALTDAVGDEVARASERYDELTRRFEAAGGYRVRAEAEAVLAGLRLPERLWSQPAAGMSGGEKSRIALARTLLSRPDVLLLDEPTNHLDINGITWLEGFLQRWPGAMIVVSHDRTFLDAVATEIWDLRGRKLTSYRGNYSAYTQQRDEQTAYQREQYTRQRDELARQQALVDRYRAGQRAKWAHGLQTRLDRTERIERPEEEAKVNIRLKGPSRTGRIALALEELAIALPGRQDHVLLRFPERVEVERGHRVAIVGGNGTGKTTLLRTLMGEHPPASGQAIWGANTRPGYYRQGTEHLDDRRSVIDELLATRNLPLQDARDLLARYLFRANEVEQLVGTLSGGQRSRLALAKLSADDVNVLLLDEPTNHLDIPSREAVESVIASYAGTVLFVTHDRTLIKRIATRTWLVQDGCVHLLDGGHYELPAPLLPRREADRQRAPAAAGLSKSEIVRQQRELSRLEGEIAAFEQRMDAVSRELERASAAGDAGRSGAAGAAYAAAERQLSDLMSAWEEAARNVEQVTART